MAVDQNKRLELTNLILECIKEVFPIVINKIEEKKYISSYFSFPTLSFRENGFPSISNNFGAFNGSKDYASLFRGYGRDPDIDWENFSTLIELYNFIREDEELLSYFGFGLKVEVPDFDINKTNVQILIENILNKYIHTYGYDFNNENFLEIIELRINFAFLEELPITIYIPILFLKFGIEKYYLMDGITIEKLSDQLHLCRAEAKSTNVLVHDCVLAGATHALVIKNYFVKNERKESYECLSYKDAYPNIKIQNFFSALRLVNNDKTGYLRKPKIGQLDLRKNYQIYMVAVFGSFLMNLN